MGQCPVRLGAFFDGASLYLPNNSWLTVSDPVPTNAVTRRRTSTWPNVRVTSLKNRGWVAGRGDGEEEETSSIKAIVLPEITDFIVGSLPCWTQIEARIPTVYIVNVFNLFPQYIVRVPSLIVFAATVWVQQRTYWIITKIIRVTCISWGCVSFCPIVYWIWLCTCGQVFYEFGALRA